MTVEDVKELLKHFEESKYDDYKIVLWDYDRQVKMDGSFGGLSHPEKEISIPIHVVEKKNWTPVKKGSLPTEVPSPFEEGAKASLKEEKNYTFDKQTYFTRYFYEDEKTGYCFTDYNTDTATMLNYWMAEAKRLRKVVKKLEQK